MKNSKTMLISGLYLGGVVSYNILTLYSNSVEQLLEYRKTKVFFKNEIESIIVGIQKNWFDNFLLSLFWPIRLPFKIIPFSILYFNSGKKDKETQTKKNIIFNEIITVNEFENFES